MGGFNSNSYRDWAANNGSFFCANGNDCRGLSWSVAGRVAGRVAGVSLGVGRWRVAGVSLVGRWSVADCQKLI
jgi:hypothetical protein